MAIRISLLVQSHPSPPSSLPIQLLGPQNVLIRMRPTQQSRHDRIQAAAGAGKGTPGVQTGVRLSVFFTGGNDKQRMGDAADKFKPMKQHIIIVSLLESYYL